MAKIGKRFKALSEMVDKEKIYEVDEAISLVKKTSNTKFDSTIEIHIRTSADPKHADQIVRNTVILPSGTGKTKKIALFCNNPNDYKNLNIEKVGGKDLINEVAGGNINFDIVVATPEIMRDMASIARILGPKGLMPSPKSGTVTDDPEKIISELKKGKIEFKTDKSGIIHSIIGKSSFSEEQLKSNFHTLVECVNNSKPSGVKGKLVETISLSSTMGPGIFVKAS